MITVRKYDPADAARLYEIECQCFTEDYRWESEATGAEQLETRDAWVAVDPYPCIEDDPIVGDFIVGFLVADVERKQGHIFTVDVPPTHRGKGIGAQLLSVAEEEYRKRGFAEMRLEVQVDNPAQTMYFKQGYRVVGVRKQYYDNGTDCIRMVKKLSPTTPRNISQTTPFLPQT